MISRVEEAENNSKKELREARIKDRADHIEAGGSQYGTAGERAKEMAIGVLCPIAGLVRSGDNQRLAEDARDLANCGWRLRKLGSLAGIMLNLMERLLPVAGHAPSPVMSMSNSRY